MERLHKQALIELVRKIINVEGSEEEVDQWLELLERNVPHPEVSDLIFYPEEESTPEQIVEKALSYKPLPLAGGSEAGKR